MSRWNRLVALLDRREPATALAVSRMVIGATVLYHLLAMWRTGAGVAVWTDLAFGGIRATTPGLLSYFGGNTPRNIQAVMLLGMVASAFLVAGRFTRPAAILTWLAWRTLTMTDDIAGGSSDNLIRNVLFVLMLSGSGEALSLDAARRSREGLPPRLVPAWPRWLLVFQIALLYWTTGLQKVGEGWIPGGKLDAIWYILQQPTWQRIDMRWAAPLYPLTQLATLTTWLFELGGPLLLLAFWFRLTRDRPGRLRAFFNRVDFRSWYLAVGLSLHLGITIAMEVGPFLGGCLACYAACFSPAEWQAFLARMKRRLLSMPA